MAVASGLFELQLLEINNPRGEVRGGGCCGAGGGARYADVGPCSTPCRTRLRLCLKEYQSNVTSTGSCSFGNATSAVLGGTSFQLDPDQEPDADLGRLVIPFAFRWTVSTNLARPVPTVLSELPPSAAQRCSSPYASVTRCHGAAQVCMPRSRHVLR